MDSSAQTEVKEDKMHDESLPSLALSPDEIGNDNIPALEDDVKDAGDSHTLNIEIAEQDAMTSFDGDDIPDGDSAGAKNGNDLRGSVVSTYPEDLEPSTTGVNGHIRTASIQDANAPSEGQSYPQSLEPSVASTDVALPHFRGRANLPTSIHRPHSYHNPSRAQYASPRRPTPRDASPVRTEYGDDEREPDDMDDTRSVRSVMTTRTLRANRPRPVTKSQKISHIQNIFTESQKIAYVGLCYLSVVHNKKSDIKSMKKANESYSQWAESFMEKLYVFLDIKDEERVMIKSLADHGLVPSDLSKSLIDDAKKAAQVIKDRQDRRQRAEEEALEKGVPLDFESLGDADDITEPTDIRYTILTHLFILCIVDGQYDSRSRAILKSVATHMEVPLLDVVKLEMAIADQLRIYEDSQEVKGDMEVVGKRNQADTKNRWIFTGLATLAGGAVIGLTAGLAAPLIAGGIGVALGTFGVTGASAALSTTGALALITTGGVLTGGGMGGFKMMKRTKGITQFEFLYIEDGLRQIEENKETRRTERRKRRRREARQALQDKMDKQRAQRTGDAEDKPTDQDGEESGEKKREQPVEETTDTEQEQLPRYEPATEEKLDRIGSWVTISESQRRQLDGMVQEENPKKIPPPIPDRPSAAELASVAERSLAINSSRRNSGLAVSTARTISSTAESTKSSSLLPSGDELGIAQDWGFDEGLGWSDTEDRDMLAADDYDDSENILGVNDHLGVGESTLLWESSPQFHSDSEMDHKPASQLPRFNGTDFDDVGTIDEDLAAAMFDDLQSTVAGDEDEGIRFKEPEGPPKAKQTNVLITVAGWITYGPDDHTLPFSTLERDVAGDQYALVWETETLQELGSALKLLVGEVASFLVQQGLQATVLSTLMIGLAGPLWVMKLSYLVDNPWGIGLSKANKAGKVLADTLMQGAQENRPVTLIGYSLGARVIFHCLLELAARGAYGIVEDAYLLGCPVMAQKKEWEQIISVVSGRLVNGYSTNDMVLGVLYRASVAVWNNVAGLRPVEGVAGVENIALDDVIQGHLDYRLCMPKVLEKLGFSITRDYFDDEDEEEEQERLELEEEQRREKEERLRAKEERLRKKQEEYEEKLRKKKEEQERKQKEREERERIKEEARKKREEERAAAAAKDGEKGSRMSWFSRRGSGRSTPTPTQEKKPQEIAKIMDEYWMPREIKSTLPPLIIKTGEDEVLTPKEIQSTLPPLVIREEVESSEIAESPDGTSVSSNGTPDGASPKSLTTSPGKSNSPALKVERVEASDVLSATTSTAEEANDDLSVTETELQRAEAEVEEAKKEVAQAQAAAAAAAAVVGAGRVKITLNDDEDLEQVMIAAQKEGAAGIGAGDLVDGGVMSDDDGDERALSAPIYLPSDLQDTGVWRKKSNESIQVTFARPVQPALKSPGVASLISSSSDDGSASVFVDAHENPWLGNGE